MPTLQQVVQYEPPVSRATIQQWQQQIDAILPSTEETSGLVLVWEPGHAWAVDGVWQVVERWFLYETFPLWTQRPEIVEELHGEPPSRLNHYNPITQQIDQVTTITQRQWDLFRRTGQFGKPFWVIQGQAGGHQWAYSQTEQRLRKLAGLSADPPLPGDLPYAPFDQRVMTHLRFYRALRETQEDIRRSRAGRTLRRKGTTQEFERQWRETYVAWLESQITMELGRDLKRAADKLGADAPRVDTDFTTEWEAAKYSFLETGRVRA